MPATHNAVYTELGSRGQADKLMIVENEDQYAQTFWRHVHEKHTPFALEPVEFDIQASQPRFNGSAKFAFPRQGDLCWHTYLHYQLPGLVGIKDGKVMRGADAPYWHPSVGFRLTRQATLAIGGNVVDTLTDTYLYVWEELTHKAGKKLREMIGAFDSVEEQQAFSKRSQHLWVPLPFSYTRDSALALPIVSLAFHQMHIEIDFCSRNDAIINPAGAQIFVRPDGMTDDEIEASFENAGSNYSRIRQLSLLQDSDLHCVPEGNLVYLENEERNRFGKGTFTQLVDELQIVPAQAYYAAPGASETTPSVKINPRMQYNNVISEYITIVRRERSDNRNYFDFSGPLDEASGLTLDPLREIGIRFNNTPRVTTRPAKFFRLVQPYQYHSNVPKDFGSDKQFIYVWSYAKNPEDALNPNGGANHTRLENVNIEYHLDPRLFSPDAPNAEVITFGRSKNLLTYKFGMIHKKLI
jgi:hypothetical protein